MIELPILIKNINNLDDNLLSLSMGEQGLKIKRLLQKLDLEHPDIKNLCDGIFADPNFVNSCNEILNFIQTIDDQKILTPLSQAFWHKNEVFLKKICLPEENRINVRFLKDIQEREQVRLSKKITTIDMHSVYKKGIHYYEAQPMNFDDFFRYGSGYQKELDKIEKRLQRYINLGCTSLAQNMTESVELYKQYAESTYYGFNRILMSHVCVILAKLLKLNYIDSDPSRIVSKANSQTKHYQPRIYPYHELRHIENDQTKKVINNLENFPEAEGKPIFDHFGVIIPSLDYSIDLNGQEKVVKNLDILYLQKNNAPAVILGEKDGKCFFVDFFRYHSINL